LARHGLLPRALSELDRTGRVPKNAMHTVFGLTMLGEFVAVHILHSGLAALTWWANAMVFLPHSHLPPSILANILFLALYLRAPLDEEFQGSADRPTKRVKGAIR